MTNLSHDQAPHQPSTSESRTSPVYTLTYSTHGVTDDPQGAQEEANWRAMMEVLATRIKDQEMIKGSVVVTYFTLLIVGMGLVSVIVFNPPQFIPFVLALMPCVVLLSLLHSNIKDRTITGALILEFLWLGAILSVIFACLMEVTAMSLSQSVESCNVATEHPTLICDLFFIMTFILAVGLSEELAKLLPIVRLTTQNKRIFHRVRWWHRYVDNPSHMVMMAVASGCGFATIENIKYVFTIEPNLTPFAMIRIAVLRGIMSVPFHFACTGVAACILAKSMFKFKPDGQWVTRRPTFRHIFLALMAPSILHGCYDAFIYLSIKTPPQLSPEAGTMAHSRWVLIPSFFLEGLYHTTTALRPFGGRTTFLDPTTTPPEVYEKYVDLWSGGCALIAFSSWLITMVLFTILWKDVQRLERKGLAHIQHARASSVLRPTLMRSDMAVAQPLLASDLT